MFPPFKNDYRHYAAVNEPGATFSPFLFSHDIVINFFAFHQETFSPRSKSLGNGVAMSMRNYYNLKHYESTLRGDFSGGTRMWQKNENGKDGRKT